MGTDGRKRSRGADTEKEVLNVAVSNGQQFFLNSLLPLRQVYPFFSV